MSDHAIAMKVLKEYWDLRPADPDLDQDIDVMRRALTRFSTAQDAEDAARYRWLRERGAEFSTGFCVSTFKGSNMDAAIDASRAAGGGG